MYVQDIQRKFHFANKHDFYPLTRVIGNKIGNCTGNSFSGLFGGYLSHGRIRSEVQLRIQGVTHKQKAKYYIYPLHNPAANGPLPICNLGIKGIIPSVSDTQFLGMEGWKDASNLSLFTIRALRS